MVIRPPERLIFSLGGIRHDRAFDVRRIYKSVGTQVGDTSRRCPISDQLAHWERVRAARDRNVPRVGIGGYLRADSRSAGVVRTAVRVCSGRRRAHYLAIGGVVLDKIPPVVNPLGPGLPVGGLWLAGFFIQSTSISFLNFSGTTPGVSRAA